jgi:hypothetical protein
MPHGSRDPVDCVGRRSSTEDRAREPTLNYMLLLYVEDRAVPGSAEAAAATCALMAYHGELEAQGVLVASDPLAPPRSATTLRERSGRLVMTDGPFAETREWLGGYFIVRCDDLDEALRLAALCPTVARGAVEVRPIMPIPRAAGTIDA